jgi:hypothetical protein
VGFRREKEEGALVESPQVIVVGAAGMDTKGRPKKTLVPGTSNPGDIRISVGGVGRNIAERAWLAWACGPPCSRP